VPQSGGGFNPFTFVLSITYLSLMLYFNSVVAKLPRLAAFWARSLDW
jgi:hypothetical protein